MNTRIRRNIYINTLINQQKVDGNVSLFTERENRLLQIFFPRRGFKPHTNNLPQGFFSPHHAYSLHSGYPLYAYKGQRARDTWFCWDTHLPPSLSHTHTHSLSLCHCATATLVWMTLGFLFAWKRIPLVLWMRHSNLNTSDFSLISATLNLV